MGKAVIGCETLKRELESAMNEVGVNYEIIWIEPGLHNTPKLLRDRLQKELDNIESEVEQILFALGFCGNSVVGLKPERSKLIIPRVEDCITLILGDDQKRKEVSKSGGTYFLTRGWLDSDKNIWNEYCQTVKKYGRKRTKELFDIMLKNYEQLGVVDTGVYDLGEFTDTTRKIADTLRLEHVIINGTLDYFKKLLTGPYDDDFVIIEPGVEVSLEHIV